MHVKKKKTQIISLSAINRLRRKLRCVCWLYLLFLSFSCLLSSDGVIPNDWPVLVKWSWCEAHPFWVRIVSLQKCQITLFNYLNTPNIWPNNEEIIRKCLTVIYFILIWLLLSVTQIFTKHQLFNQILAHCGIGLSIIESLHCSPACCKRRLMQASRGLPAGIILVVMKV